MAVVEQRLHHDADGVGEVDQPRAGSAAALGFLGDIEHDRHGAQCLGESSWTGCLLSDATELEGQGFVDKARGLAADPELDDDEAGAVERPLSILGHRKPARPLMPLQDATRQPADYVEPLVIDVVKDELVDRQAVAPGVESLDQLRRIRAAAADHCNFYPHEVRAPTSRHPTREYVGIVRDV